MYVCVASFWFYTLAPLISHRRQNLVTPTSNRVPIVIDTNIDITIIMVIVTHAHGHKYTCTYT